MTVHKSVRKEHWTYVKIINKLNAQKCYLVQATGRTSMLKMNIGIAKIEFSSLKSSRCRIFCSVYSISNVSFIYPF